MKTGTPGFVPDRLSEARIARGLSVTKLAEELSVSRQAVTNYENGKNTPQPDVLNELATILGVPASHFLRDYKPQSLATVFFRSLVTTPQYVRASAEQKLSWLKRIVAYLEEYIVFPETTVPRVNDSDPLRVSTTEIEQLAQQTRRDWGIGDGPIASVSQLLESRGIVMSRFPLLDRRIDGFSEWKAEERPYIVLNADKDSASRSRFDAAHELGHLVLHGAVAESGKWAQKALEEQAHRFASAFLLPAESFTRDFYVPNLDIFMAMKEKWRVSVKSMVYRCVSLGIVDDDMKRRLWIDYSRRGWQSGEPLDNTFPEKPRFLERSIEMLVGEGGQTPQDVLDALAMSSTDVTELAGLRPSFFGDAHAWRDGMPRLRHAGDDGSSTMARIVHLPRRTN